MPLQGLRHRPPRRAKLGARRSRPHRRAARPTAPRRAPRHLGRPAGRHPFAQGSSKPQDRSAFVAGHVPRRFATRFPPASASACPAAISNWKSSASPFWSPNGWITRPPVGFRSRPPRSNAPSTWPDSPSSLRLDRIDRLNDGSLLVIDYKTGDVSPKSWDLPRPDDVQLPLYAGFALDPRKRSPGRPGLCQGPRRRPVFCRPRRRSGPPSSPASRATSSLVKNASPPSS
jgi:hypothetical protein